MCLYEAEIEMLLCMNYILAKRYFKKILQENDIFKKEIIWNRI